MKGRSALQLVLNLPELNESIFSNSYLNLNIDLVIKNSSFQNMQKQYKNGFVSYLLFQPIGTSSIFNTVNYSMKISPLIDKLTFNASEGRFFLFNNLKDQILYGNLRRLNQGDKYAIFFEGEDFELFYKVIIDTSKKRLILASQTCFNYILR